MPVTAKLSRKFYDQFGDDIANELVEWFNKVDATYKSELRELNDLNWTRFDARLELRLADQTAAARAEMAAVEERLTARISSLRERINEQGGALRAEIASLDKDLSARVASLEVTVERALVSQTRWMVGLWGAQVMALVGTILIILQTR